MATANLTAARLREALDYNPDTGVFTWRIRMGMRGRIGATVGWENPQGYLTCNLDKTFQKMHRLAWLYMTGEWPRHSIDHINGNRSDNRWLNLRDVTTTQNQQNRRKAQASSTSGLFGASKNGNGWAARVSVNGVRHYIGHFNTPEEAHAAYLEAKRRLHKTCSV